MKHWKLMKNKLSKLHHKQNTWSGDDNDTMENFIKWAKTLPYAEEFIFEEYK